MRIIEGQTFTSTFIVMDETYFVNCTFDNCSIVYCGGDFSWQKCKFINNCKVSLQGLAGRTHAFLKHFHLVKEPAPETPMPPVTDTSGYVH